MTLDLWLTLATHKLAPESVEQVRAEIAEHCADGAVDVAALGDPREANRAYRNVLLTKTEASMLATMRRQESSRIAPWVGILLLAPCWIFMWTNPPMAMMFVSGFTGALEMLLPTPVSCWNILFRSAKWLLLIAAIAFCVTMPGWWAMLGVGFFQAYSEYIRFVLRRKLPTAAWPKAVYY